VQIGRAHHGGMLVEPGGQLEQNRTAGLAEGRKAQLVRDHQVHAHQSEGDLARLPRRLLLIQDVHQTHDRVKAHPLAVLANTGYAEVGSQVRHGDNEPKKRQVTRNRNCQFCVCRIQVPKAASAPTWAAIATQRI
jgi:hypothetical protein